MVDTASTRIYSPTSTCVEALETLRALSRFGSEVVACIETFDDFPAVGPDQVVNGRAALLDSCISAHPDGIP